MKQIAKITLLGDDLFISKPIKSQPGRPRSVQAHQAILQATLDLLAEVGYQDLSIEAIRRTVDSSGQQLLTLER